MGGGGGLERVGKQREVVGGDVSSNVHGGAFWSHLSLSCHIPVRNQF